MDLSAWVRLVRLPTVFTLIANVAGAYIYVAAGPWPLPRFAAVVVAGVLLYWSGMIFNDVMDIEVDRRERPGRVLPSGQIALGSARRAAVGLMLLGIVVGGLSGYLPAPGSSATPSPGIISLLLALAILLYDGPLKETVWGPVAMGACRVLSFLLGASPVIADGAASGVLGFPTHVWGAAVGYGVFVMGITIIARGETGETPRSIVAVGLAVMSSGLLLMGLAPFVAPPETVFFPPWASGAAVFIGLLSGGVLVRGWRTLGDGGPPRVQGLVRVGLLTLIPLAATFATLGAGRVAGLAIFSLLVPAIVLSSRIRMT